MMEEKDYYRILADIREEALQDPWYQDVLPAAPVPPVFRDEEELQALEAFQEPLPVPRPSFFQRLFRRT